MTGYSALLFALFCLAPHRLDAHLHGCLLAERWVGEVLERDGLDPAR